MTKIELITIQLAEECSEVSQMCSKILRFGYTETRKGQHLTNKQRLIDELNDLIGVADFLSELGTLPKEWIDKRKIELKKQKIKKYINYSKELGIIRDNE